MISNQFLHSDNNTIILYNIIYFYVSRSLTIVVYIMLSTLFSLVYFVLKFSKQVPLWPDNNYKTSADLKCKLTCY